MSTDSGTFGSDVKPEKLTEHEQQLADEATTFVLAGIGLDMYTAVQFKASKRFSDCLQKMNLVLKQDPGFLPRFRAAQAAILKGYIEEASVEPVVTDGSPSAETVVKSNPPESLL